MMSDTTAMTEDTMMTERPTMTEDTMMTDDSMMTGNHDAVAWFPPPADFFILLGDASRHRRVPTRSVPLERRSRAGRGNSSW